MVVTKIDPSDMPKKLLFGRPLAEETVAIRALLPGEAIRFPCRWKHSDRLCHGYGLALQTAKRAGFRIRSVCRDGVVYVMRKPGQNEEGAA
jgi:hypothetical protein